MGEAMVALLASVLKVGSVSAGHLLTLRPLAAAASAALLLGMGQSATWLDGIWCGWYVRRALTLGHDNGNGGDISLSVKW